MHLHLVGAFGRASLPRKRWIISVKPVPLLAPERRTMLSWNTLARMPFANRSATIPPQWAGKCESLVRVSIRLRGRNAR